VKLTRRYVRPEIARIVRDVATIGERDPVAGRSKTLRSLARLVLRALDAMAGPDGLAGPALGRG
jgi:exopolyphosphatase/pppGpp-phosphohydrolase